MQALGSGPSEGSARIRGGESKDGLPAGLFEGEMGQDGVLAKGFGFSGADRRSQLRNLVEQTNIEQFIQSEGETPSKDLAQPRAKADPERAKAGAQDKSSLQEAKQEPREAEPLRAQHLDELTELALAELLGHELPEFLKDERPLEKEGEKHQRDRQGEEDEEDRPGAGWTAEELDEREGRRKVRRKGSTGLGEATRCKAFLPDGTRCLMKPEEGTPYCRVHRNT